jgi:hypothetical protein
MHDTNQKGIGRRLLLMELGLVALLVAALVGVRAATASDAAAPVNSSLPTITGTAQEGQTLKAAPGTWSGGGIDFSYQWRRCGPNGGHCSNVAKATDQLYTAGGGDVGHTLRVVVTAVNADGAASALSKHTGVVTAAPKQAPRNTSLPTISGRFQEGQVLRAGAGQWSGTQPLQFSYRWRRCDSKGGTCHTTNLVGPTFHLDSDDVGRTLRVLVTATNSAGSSAAVSNPTGVIQSSGPPPGTCLAIGAVSSPQRLVIDQVQYSPSRVHSRSQPLVARFHVVTTRGFCVSGAAVYAAGVPFNRLSPEPEVSTGPDGWAQIMFQVLPTFPLKRGNLVVLFVRARKPGESLLAGVSTRRLVSVRVG